MVNRLRFALSLRRVIDVGPFGRGKNKSCSRVTLLTRYRWVVRGGRASCPLFKKRHSAAFFCLEESGRWRLEPLIQSYSTTARHGKRACV